MRVMIPRLCEIDKVPMSKANLKLFTPQDVVLSKEHYKIPLVVHLFSVIFSFLKSCKAFKHSSAETFPSQNILFVTSRGVMFFARKWRLNRSSVLDRNRGVECFIIIQLFSQNIKLIFCECVI